jgi:DNA (cytosine-5)-methyltransferase 1
MRHVDLFSGMLGFSEALRRAFPESYELVLACEIEPACRRVILHHRPGVRLVKDVRGLHCARDEADVITFGSPCQDLSVAGRREGLAGERSGLFFHAVRILEAVRPRWFIFENVPGLLSSNGGRDMGTVLGEFSRLGYWWAYRVLDAQYFGVPQRRRRVFVVGHSGDGAGPLSVLFEPESVCGDPPPSREKGTSVASAITGGLGSGGPDDNQAQAGWIVPVAFHATQDPISGDVAPCIGQEGSGSVAVAVAQNQRGELRTSDIAHQLNSGGGIPGQGYSAVLVPTLGKESRSPAKSSSGQMVDFCVGSGMRVRRLTPLECLRLQGFPDDWLDGLDLSDSAKYRMIGNGVALPVVEWIARRIAAHDKEK